MICRTRSRLLLLVVFAGVAGGNFAVADDDTTSRRWNILFLFTDDQPHCSVSAYEDGWPWMRTPHIDQLARSGVRFEHAFCGTWCSVSRAMVLSGRHLHSLERPQRVRTDDGLAPIWLPALRGAGYRTGIIGKFDLPPSLIGPWDRSVVWNLWHGTRLENGKRTGLDFDGAQYYRGAALSIDGAEPRVVNGYSTDIYTDFAIDFIKTQGRGGEHPWFLWLCYGAPHVPSTPPERYANLYADAMPQVANERDLFGPRENVPRYQRTRSAVTRNGDRVERAYPPGILMSDLKRDCARTVRAIDDNVGRLIQCLRETGQIDRTLIVYTSDNGLPFGEHGFINKIGPYDACQRVPMIVSGPAPIARGRVCPHPVGALDLIPTFFRVAGAKPPYQLHGQDLFPLLQEQVAPEWPHPVLLEFFGFQAGTSTHGGLTPYEIQENQPSPRGIPWWLSLRQGRYKYIRTLVKDEIEELYDIGADPREQRNLAVEAPHQDRLRELRAALQAELRRTGGEALADNLPQPLEIANE